MCIYIYIYVCIRTYRFEPCIGIGEVAAGSHRQRLPLTSETKNVYAHTYAVAGRAPGGAGGRDQKQHAAEGDTRILIYIYICIYILVYISSMIVI